MTSYPMSINASNLCQGYGRADVLHHLSFSLEGPGIVGLLGPNGAGKSTLIKTLIAQYPPRSGNLHVRGTDVHDKKAVRALRQQLGYLPQNHQADRSFTAHEFVSYALWMREYDNALIASAASTALDKVGLTQDAHTKLSKFSGGMYQRAGIAAAIAGEPSIIVLDEPTAGLDPQQRAQFRQVLRSLTDSLCILSTHLVEDVHVLADTLLVLNDGIVTYCGPTQFPESASIEDLEAHYAALLG
ncbi:ATP-binding cassette domain-containing protein [Trueperella pecoris]|uniref:ATP-binding cassette domain-containing protein n=1 Tax=Trueperella pecoris TaxID=2733571 RepID=A0A7M1R2J0_9ACTO|nr:ATP-binding cassette domain-containing protein [Trueperella pecoris]